MKKVRSTVYYISLLVFFVAAIYRLAILITVDSGPLGVFEKIRTYIQQKVYEYNKKYGAYRSTDKFTILDYWKYVIANNLDEGINCTDCTGVWSGFILAPILALAMKYRIVGLIIFALGGAGFQHYITNREDNELVV